MCCECAGDTSASIGHKPLRCARKVQDATLVLRFWAHRWVPQSPGHPSPAGRAAQVEFVQHGGKFCFSLSLYIDFFIHVYCASGVRATWRHNFFVCYLSIYLFLSLSCASGLRATFRQHLSESILYSDFVWAIIKDTDFCEFLPGQRHVSHRLDARQSFSKSAPYIGFMTNLT